MKRLSAFIACLTILLISGCEPAATFDQPQPKDVKSLDAFPARLQGQYLAGDEASTLIISGERITRLYDVAYHEHKDSLGTSYRLFGDTLFHLADSSREIVRVKGDTVFRHFRGTDTLFDISADNVLKKFKGYYFLNSRFGDTAWEVKKIALQKGTLLISTISSEEDIRKLQAITESSADTASRHFSPTRRQFKKFIKQKGFGEQESFIRLPENSR